MMQLFSKKLSRISLNRLAVALIPAGVMACGTHATSSVGDSTAAPAQAAQATISQPSQNNLQPSPSGASEANLVTATTKTLSKPTPATPSDLAARLKRGGLVIFHRYTGAMRGNTSVSAAVGTYDDSQRISPASVKQMQTLGEKYRALGIPVDNVYSSEYFFVWQHANEAFGKWLGKPIVIHRDMTGSLFFRDANALEASLQGLRNRTVTPPPANSNTVLFTHQGKFDKAYGYYPDAGRTLIFEPDGTGVPKVIANMPLDEFLRLQ